MDRAHRRVALGLQPLALIDAEPVLLVDHRQTQAVEPHTILEQGVGADGDAGGSLAKGQQPAAPLRRRVTAGQQDGVDPGGREQGRRRNGLDMLARENLGRRHQGGLNAGRRRIGHGKGRHSRLARAHILLQQPTHLPARGEVAAKLRQGLNLGARQAEGQGGCHGVRGLAGADHRGGGGHAGSPATS